jgi:hypothetical protein
LKTQKIKVNDSNVDEIEKVVFVNDNGNIIEESDINYIVETFDDEFKTTQHRNITNIRKNKI